MNTTWSQNLHVSEPDWNTPADEDIEVRGWASDNFATSEIPAVIVNPQADPVSLLSWGVGQLQQCNAMLGLVGEFGGPPADAARLAECVLHFLSQAETVLHAGIERLNSVSLGAVPHTPSTD